MNSSLNIYLLDDFFISKSLFIGKKPDYKVSVKDIILTTTKAVFPLLHRYYLHYDMGIDKKTGKWADGTVIEEEIPKTYKEFSELLFKKLFSKNLNNENFELELVSKDNRKVFYWGLDSYGTQLQVTSKEFELLKQILLENSIPKDLYYKDGEEIKAIPLDKNPTSILRRIFKLKKTYTPKEWDEHLN